MTGKYRTVVVSGLLFLGLGFTAILHEIVAAAPPRTEQWKKVMDAEAKGLPKTAIQELDPIIALALKEKAYPEAIKAIAKKIALEGSIEGNKPEERITRMKAEIAKAPKEMVPVMDALLAHWYWHYFQQNRWQFMQRTQTAVAPSEDFTTWDLARILATVDAQFTKALASEKELQAIPIASYDELLEKGTLPDTYRPTLFDFLAFEALSFYTSPEQAGAKAEDSFEIVADSPALADAAEFMKWLPQSTDTTSRKLKAIQLFQKLMAFHQADADKTAYLDADLQRLQFCHAEAVGEEKTTRYQAALQRFADTNAKHELSALARYRIAQLVHDAGDRVEAKKIAQQTINLFPTSAGGISAFNLIQQIEAKSLNMNTERVWNDPPPVIRVQYRNLTKLHFRLYKTAWSETVVTNQRSKLYEPNLRKALLAQKADVEFATDLPATADYQDRTHDVPVPKNVKPGYYVLFASDSPDFTEAKGVISGTDLWVSDLALITRTEYGDPQFEGFVLNAKSGEPIAGAKVQTWYHTNRNQTYLKGPLLTTDKNGLYTVRGENNTSWIAHVSHDGHELSSANQHYLNQADRNPQPFQQTVFFTDRSLYRPGQTVQFKGICFQSNQLANKYDTIPNKAVTVQFTDVNGQLISKLDVKTNDYGSFNGSFTAPRDRLMGQMMISVQGDAPGQSAVTVEEYKRPKFQVTIDAPKEAAKLNTDVKLTGKATSYTGAAIGGAKVRYRVVREVRYPGWWYSFYYWRMPPNQGSAQEITHGVTTTEADGTFTVTFPAKPDRSIAEKDEPSFTFTLTADVTDTTGETRVGTQSVRVGYTTISATVSAGEWQTTTDSIKFKVSTQTLDGVGQATKGTLKVYRLKQPATVQRADILGGKIGPRPVARGRGGMPIPQPVPDPANAMSWEQGDEVASLPFTTDASGNTELTVKLDLGVFRAIVETADPFGKPVAARQQVTILKPDAATLGIKLPQIVAAPKWSLEPGQEFNALWGTGYETGRAYIEIEHRRKILQAFWTEPGLTQFTVKQAVTESHRGGFTLRVTFVRENRAYIENRKVDVPWTNKNLTVKWERFVSKLEPGKPEKWTAVVSGPDAKKAVAEMVAALYDQSLDAYLPHSWMSRFNSFYQDYSQRQSQFENTAKPIQTLGGILGGYWPVPFKNMPSLSYRHFPTDLTQNFWQYGFQRQRGFGGGGIAPGTPSPMSAAPAIKSAKAMDALLNETENYAQIGSVPNELNKVGLPPAGPDLSKVAARLNLQETAFFFPHLIADESGTVRMEFTMPEALTKWKFHAFAHDQQMRSGSLDDSVVTAKDLMVQPNPPRFLREGDVLEFTVKVSNQSATRQVGKVRLSLADARTGNAVDAALGLTVPDQNFDIAAKESKSFSWALTVPDGLGPITYKAVGAAERFSDGEEGMLPVLSKRVLVTESLPLPIRGKQTKTFDFTKLRESAKSDTLKSQSLTVQMTSNPSWYAVMALPYLMEYPHDCAEQTFNRLYANALARHIATSDPKIRRVFDQWKNTPALDSPLEKNQDVKAVILEETPWVRDAKQESESRRNVGILFDENRLNEETTRLLRRLTELQAPDGGWSWFPGGPRNEYITLYITTGFGRLRNLGVKIDVAPAVRSITALDAWADRIYRDILKHSKNKDDNHLSTTIALYLYGRSFFIDDRPVAKEHQEAVNYWLGQSKKYWLKIGNRQSQAHLALGLKRFGDKTTPAGIMASLKEFSVTNEEMGMFWRDTEVSWWWYHAPIETQAMMIEAFDEVSNDAKAVEECKVWLLKQKQTQNWKTTKATADAVYALLLRGDNLLKSDALVDVTVGPETIKPEKVEAGTGFYEQKFLRGEVKPEFGTVKVTKTDDGVSWGSVHWQYLEDISKVTPHDGTPLKLEKKLFKRVYTKTGPTLEAVNGPVNVGDEIVVRIVLRTDRDMEYVHMKDHRGSGTEPVNVLSRYKFQDGLGYYESTKDTASHFFMDYLPKGTYVFEYAVRVQHRGKYPTGLASIECMYAPEFNSHSESIGIEAK